MFQAVLVNAKKTLRENPQSLDFIELMAEKAGFELTVPVKGHLICLKYIVYFVRFPLASIARYRVIA